MIEYVFLLFITGCIFISDANKTCKEPSVCGNAYGACCKFPFVYKKTLYDSCTTKDYDKFWCATTKDYDTDKQWGECKDMLKEPVYPTTGGNADGLCCRFPFRYKNKAYYGCTKKDYEKFWCATTSNYDRDEKWGLCPEDKTCKEPSVCGNARVECCQFPFVYEKKLYHSCTTKDHDNFWCATTMDYDADKEWGDCAGLRKAPAHYTIGGNADGRCCKFPFVYKKQTYRDCTKKDYDQFWCATTSNYDRDEKWGLCAGRVAVVDG